MGKKSRDKGASGEREFCSTLGNLIGLSCLHRNLDQTRAGGYDLVVDGSVAGRESLLRRLNQLAIEVKRYHTSTPYMIRKWWSQACRQAAAAGRRPALVFREDRGRWQCLIPASEKLPDTDINGTARMDIILFAEYLLADDLSIAGNWHGKSVAYDPSCSASF